MLFNLFPQVIIILALASIIYVFARKQKLVYNKEKQILEFVKNIDYKKYFNLIKKFIKNQIKQIIKPGVKAEKKQKKTSVDFMIEEQKYIQIIAQDPKNIFAYQKLGSLYLEQDNQEDAKAAFKQILKLDPDNQEAKNKLKMLE